MCLVITHETQIPQSSEPLLGTNIMFKFCLSFSNQIKPTPPNYDIILTFRYDVGTSYNSHTAFLLVLP